MDRSSEMCRPVDERIVGSSKERKKREERERECDGFLGLIGNDLSEAKTKLYIGEREREWRAKMK